MREHRARAQELRGRTQATERDAEADVLTARANIDDQWAEMHGELARSHLARADRDTDEAQRHEHHARELEQLGLAAEQRAGAAEQLAAVADARGEEAATDDMARHRAEAEAEAEERARRADEREQRISERIARRRQRERMGLRRYRPGPGTEWGSSGMPLQRAPVDEEDLDRVIDAINRAVEEQGAIDRDELARRVGARYWGPGRFARALREAVGEGRIRRLSRRTFAPAEQPEPAGRR